MNAEKTIIMSLGGSLIVPNQIDTEWIKEFKNLIENLIKKGYKFVIITGGGKTARNYQESAKSLTKLTSDDLDWLGIHATRINAHLIRTIFRENSHPKIIKNPNEEIDFKENILVASGFKPGNSTDYVAVLIAKNLGAKKLINLSNIDYIYNKDPNKFQDAEKIKEISWKDFRKIVGDKWDPGLNSPFDPVASKKAQEQELEVAIINGKKLREIENYLEEKEFIGSVIK